MIKDYFRLAIENIRHRKLRSMLTIIGIVIGIAAVVALVSLGQGVKKVVTDEFQKLGTDKIFVYPAAGFTGSSGGAPLTQNDIDDIERVKGVNEVIGVSFSSARVEYHRELYVNIVIGYPTGEGQKLADESYSMKYIEGRPLKDGDKYKAVIGYELTQKTFDKPVGLGDKLIVNGQAFDVVGIIDKMGDPDMDNGIVIPMDTYMDLYDTEEFNYLLVRVVGGDDPENVADEIKRKLRDTRNVDEGEEDFVVQTISQLMDSVGVILDALSAIVIGIAAISLFVGGVGIMNTMYTAVLQRTNEIGVMKAIGARNDQILKLFLIESGMIGLIGGVIGIAIGIGLSKIIEFIGRVTLNTILLKAYFPWYLILGALAFAFIVGTLSGLLPARQASKQSPVESLRYE
jgi:putative ABC transport system permease protein